ncbi:fumarylacetoacetate hydrolase family protein [Methylobacterium nigriterrae]|uniref:fumarylacetoacetate hydrolase family protein n=1 Tax=Methylobacterium nigriterrae TaxID=3127512 RepID=UPI0030137DF8
MPEPFDPLPAASLLAETWRAGRLISELPAAIRPRTMAEGYAIQDRFLDAIAAERVGWKLAIGSHKGKRESGIGRSIAGHVLREHLFADGARLRMPNAAPVTIEFEIAFIVGRDVPPGETVAEPLSIVSETRAAFELVLSRFVDRRAVGWPSFAADNAAFQALVLGDRIDPASLPEVARTLTVSVDGVERARAVSGDDETDPSAALGDLLALARERGFTVPRGSIVSTGTLSAPFLQTGAAAISATYRDRRLSFSLDRE